jgi:hypothetical protein
MFFEQIETACLNDADVPWVPFTPYSEHVMVKYFKLDAIRGETIALLKAPAKGEMPRHRHTGTVIVYTVQGRWKYREHDWIAETGSIVYDIIHGELVFVDENGRALATENWRSGWERYAGYCRAHGLPPKDLTAFG